MKKNFIIYLLLFLAGCTKTEYIIEEPVKNSSDDKAPYSFDLSVGQITDHEATLMWTAALDSGNKKVTYEVAVNDSVVAYDLVNTGYQLTDLLSNTELKVSVIALDPNRNSTTVSTTFKTLKSLINKVIDPGFDFKWHEFTVAVETEDGGMILGGRVTESTLSEEDCGIVVKLTKGYDIEWIKILSGCSPVNNLILTQDGGCLVFTDNKLIKLNTDGLEQWNYTRIESELFTIDSAIEDSNGDILVAGISGITTFKSYGLVKISSNGTKLWTKNGDSMDCWIGTIIKDELKNPLILGYVSYNGSSNLCLMLMWLDWDGNLIKNRQYPNKYLASDLSKTIKYIDQDASYLIFGTACGYISGYGYYDTEPRFLKITTDGEIVWDKYYYLNSGGVFPSIQDAYTISNGSSLVLCIDDRGNSISVIDALGEIEKTIKLYGYPYLISINRDDDGNYRCVARDGRIFILNHDGYSS